MHTTDGWVATNLSAGRFSLPGDFLPFILLALHQGNLWPWRFVASDYDSDRDMWTITVFEPAGLPSASAAR